MRGKEKNSRKRLIKMHKKARGIVIFVPWVKPSLGIRACSLSFTTCPTHPLPRTTLCHSRGKDVVIHRWVLLSVTKAFPSASIGEDRWGIVRANIPPLAPPP